MLLTFLAWVVYAGWFFSFGLLSFRLAARWLPIRQPFDAFHCVWMGLGVSLVVFQTLHYWLALNQWVLLGVGVASLVILAVWRHEARDALRGLGWMRPARGHGWWLLGTALWGAAILLAASRATDLYDSLGYHAQSVLWAHQWPLVQGAALFSPLFSQATVSFLLSAPWAFGWWRWGFGGLLNSFLLLMLGWNYLHLLRVREGRGGVGELRLRAYLLLSLLFPLYFLGKTELHSLSRDLGTACFALVMVLQWLLADAQNKHAQNKHAQDKDGAQVPDVAGLMVAGVMAAAAVASKIIMLPVALGFLVWCGWHLRWKRSAAPRGQPKLEQPKLEQPKLGKLKLLTAALLLPIWMAVNLHVHQYVLSGWLHWPSEKFHLGGDWSLPPHVGSSTLKGIRRISRVPTTLSGLPPQLSQSLTEGSWLKAVVISFRPWLLGYTDTQGLKTRGFLNSRHRLLLVLSTAVGLLWIFWRRQWRSLLAGHRLLMGMCLGGVLWWFVLAPDYRHILGLFWALWAASLAPWLAQKLPEKIIPTWVAPTLLVLALIMLAAEVAKGLPAALKPADFPRFPTRLVSIPTQPGAFYREALIRSGGNRVFFICSAATPPCLNRTNFGTSNDLSRRILMRQAGSPAKGYYLAPPPRNP